MEEVPILAQKAKIDSEEVTAAELKYEIRKNRIKINMIFKLLKEKRC